MEIKIKIKVDGNNCGYDCPFKEEGLRFGGKCLLFKEPLEQKMSYGRIDGLIRCDSCLRIKEPSEDK